MNRFAQFSNFFVLAAVVCALVLPPAVVASADELVENSSSPTVQVTGPWTTTSGDPGSDSSEYLIRPPSTGDATVFWPFPSTTSAGQYEVFARWTSGPNRASSTYPTIANNGNAYTVNR